MEDKYSNRSISRLLKSVATAYILNNENRFRIVAYEKAADAVEHLAREVMDIWKEGKLEQVPGIGPSIFSHLDEYFSKGKSSHFEKVLSKIPKAVFVLMEIPTIGPKKAFRLVNELGLNDEIKAVSDLKKAAKNNKISMMEGFGEKSQEDILEAIKIYEKRSIKEERMVLPYAFSIAEKVIEYMEKNPYVKKIDKLGSLRRMVETIGDVDLAVIADEESAAGVIDHFTKYPGTIKVDNKGAKKASIIVPPNVRVDLRIQPKESYGSMLQYFTGSKNHNIKLREYALKKGLSLSEYGIKNLKTGKTKEFPKEEDFYEFLGLKYVSPLLREGTTEIEASQKNLLPKLINLKDIKGDLHIHSSFDIASSHDKGLDDVDVLVDKAKSLNYQYLGFADHNPKSTLLDSQVIELLKKRKEHIEKKLMDIQDFGYFLGLEVDIFPNGHIALPHGADKYLDYMVISVHSSFVLKPKEMTKRVLEALKNPKVKILGHPTGRYFGKRDGYQLEWEKIFEICKKNDIALEINSWPERLDLKDTLVREAVKSNVKLVIDTDAHAAIHMDNMPYGVAVAGRGWAERKNIVNTLGLNDFRKWITSS